MNDYSKQRGRYARQRVAATAFLKIILWGAARRGRAGCWEPPTSGRRSPSTDRSRPMRASKCVDRCCTNATDRQPENYIEYTVVAGRDCEVPHPIIDGAVRLCVCRSGSRVASPSCRPRLPGNDGLGDYCLCLRPSLFSLVTRARGRRCGKSFLSYSRVCHFFALPPRPGREEEAMAAAMAM